MTPAPAPQLVRPPTVLGRPLRALWLARRCLQHRLGGDTIQIERTAEALRELGVEVTMAAAPGPDVDRYDLVHVFHLDRVWENLHHCRMLQARNIPVLLTPIFWACDDFDRRGRALSQRLIAKGLGTNTLRTVRLAYQWVDHVRRSPLTVRETRPVLGFRRGVRAILDAAALVLPSSHSERQTLESHFGVQVDARIVPGAANASVFHDRGAPAERVGVLCAGRIEPRKNQLSLIKALRDVDVPLTIVGNPGPTAGAYARQCRKVGGDRVRFLSGLTQEQVALEYRRARVHASVSWYETPGLVNLEAALSGCAVVATKGGCTEEYLGRHAHYCEPDDIGSIRAAVLAGLEAGPSAALSARVKARYTWELAARHTLDAYQEVLDGARRVEPRRAQRSISISPRLERGTGGEALA